MYDDDDAGAPPKMQAGLIAAGVILGVALLGGVLLVAFTGPEQRPAATPVTQQPAIPVARPQPVVEHVRRPPAELPVPRTAVELVKAPTDPWPECVAVRKWWKENLPDPSSVEVIAWAERTEVPPVPDRPGKFVNLKVKTRETNEYGGKSVVVRFFHTANGIVKYTQIER